MANLYAAIFVITTAGLFAIHMIFIYATVFIHVTGGYLGKDEKRPRQGKECIKKYMCNGSNGVQRVSYPKKPPGSGRLFFRTIQEEFSFSSFSAFPDGLS